MGEKRTEACGRCAMSAVVEVVEEGRGDERSERADRDPFAGERIEVDDADLRKVSPGAWLGGLKRRIDDLAARLTYRR